MTKRISPDIKTQELHMQIHIENAKKILNPYIDCTVEEIVQRFNLSFFMKNQLPNKISEASESAQKQLARLIVEKYKQDIAMMKKTTEETVFELIP